MAILAMASVNAAESAASKNTSTGFVESEYRLNAGDVVRIEVFGEPDLNVTAKVSDGGTIDYPFLGQLQIRGRTTGQVANQLADQLGGKYLRDPQVTVSIESYRPFFVNGQVKSPGSFAFQPGMTVRKAISLAGGLTERASTRNIQLIPEGQKESGKARKVELDAAIGPGDILTVEESFF